MAGVALVALLLVYEQSLVCHDDLSQVKRAFDLNGYVGILYLVVTTAVARLTVASMKRGTCSRHRDARRGRRGLRAKQPERIAGMFDAIAPRTTC